MICKNCSVESTYPGRIIKITGKHWEIRCADCGNPIRIERYYRMNSEYHREKIKRWDTYFHSICVSVSSKSSCLSRKIGAILVREKVIIATGFNGPPRGYPHCITCIRKEKKFKSGEGLHLCPATHAEGNCIASAARIGSRVSGSTLYLNCIIPCKDCMALIINAGIVEVVVDKIEPYHEMSLLMAKEANLKIREFII